MMADPGTIQRALALILISRNLERIADHATNIAEDVIFIAEAKDVRHHAEERQTSHEAAGRDGGGRAAGARRARARRRTAATRDAACC